MPMPKITDIVKFVNADTEAAAFCCDRGITGKIISVVNGLYEIDVGFNYTIYSAATNLLVVASQLEIPIPEDC